MNAGVYVILLQLFVTSILSVSINEEDETAADEKGRDGKRIYYNKTQIPGIFALIHDCIILNSCHITVVKFVSYVLIFCFTVLPIFSVVTFPVSRNATNKLLQEVVSNNLL